jgi:hypothetical protein
MKQILALILLVASFGLKAQENYTSIEIKYLHGDRRCEACQKIETAIRKTLARHFRSQLQSKQITFNIYNFETEENKEFASKYEIWGSALIFKINKGGKEELVDFSEIAHQKYYKEKAFIATLRAELEKHLK